MKRRLILSDQTYDECVAGLSRMRAAVIEEIKRNRGPNWRDTDPFNDRRLREIETAQVELARAFKSAPRVRGTTKTEA